jgi:hypothetical protein
VEVLTKGRSTGRTVDVSKFVSKMVQFVPEEMHEALVYGFIMQEWFPTNCSNTVSRMRANSTVGGTKKLGQRK